MLQQKNAFELEDTIRDELFTRVLSYRLYPKGEGRRVVAELKPPISLAQLLPQVLAWHELECACPAQGLAKLHSEEARSKHTLRLDSVNADVLELAEDLLDNSRVDENSLGDDVLDQRRLRWTIFCRG